MKKLDENQNFNQNKFWDDLLKSIRTTENIIQNDDYIDWLERFTQKYESFADSDWIYSPDDISEEDKDNVSKLSSFVSAISLYAKKNYIYGGNDYEEIYFISHNNIGYEIGTISHQGTISYGGKCEITETNSDKFIDFKLIQKNKITDRAEIINKKLNELDSFINSLAEVVPLEAIEKTVQKKIGSLKVKKND